MQLEGPPLELLLKRLSDCPPEFLETCTSRQGDQQLTAILADHFRHYGPQVWSAERARSWRQMLAKFPEHHQAPRHWGLLAIAIWLIHDDWFLERAELFELGWTWLLCEELGQLSLLIKPTTFIDDPDRREELARLCLAAHGLRPAEESLLQARDRLSTLDSVERQRVLQATAAAERRAREVREAMARRKALESASRYGE